MEQKDQFIFVCAVVGRAMGNPANDKSIEALTEEAVRVFEKTWGKPEAKPIQPYSADSGWPSMANATPPPQTTKSSPSSSVPPSQPPAAGKEPGPAEGKPFQLWGNDKLKLGKSTESPLGKPWSEVTWAEAHQLCTGGSAKAAGYLAFLRDLALKGDKWDASNATIKARAAAVLASVGR